MVFFVHLLAYMMCLVENHHVSVHFENIRTNQGTLLVGVYTNQAQWKIRKPLFEVVLPKTNWKDGKMTAEIPGFGSGVYGIAVLDDINDNQVVDMGLIFPKEGFGFSNYEHKTWFLPTFDDFDFTLPENHQITIRIRYLD